jgi:dTDP-4-amino-4,6-dideoxygalactose transaminase
MSQLALFGGSRVRSTPFPEWPIFGEEEEIRLLQTLRSGRWGRLDGSQVEAFERRFAAMHGCGHAVAVVNGTVALRVALLAAGIRAEDEVIVPPYTFVATASAVVETNAVPVFADVDLKTFNLNPGAVASAVTPRTKAIIPVHFAGQPADIQALAAIAKERKLVLIEDAAHAHGASFREQPAGSLGDLATFSFQSSKNLTSGEGGIITTNDARLADACRSIQNCGRIPDGVWYEHHVISGNYRLGEFQGAILDCQLDRLEEQTRRRDANGQHLAGRLCALPGLHPQARPAECTRHSYHLFMLRLDPVAFGASRNAVVQALDAEGIPCSSGYGLSLHKQPLFRNNAFGPYLSGAAARLDYTKTQCPVSDLLCEQAIWLGQNLLLGSRDDMEDIAHAFEKVYEHRDELRTAVPC